MVDEPVVEEPEEIQVDAEEKAEEEEKVGEPVVDEPEEIRSEEEEKVGEPVVEEPGVMDTGEP